MDCPRRMTMAAFPAARWSVPRFSASRRHRGGSHRHGRRLQSRPADALARDFAKIVEAFDANGVSFVSVTQQFNTTTSMGRLTLNVLLSFAQFEREVTGERIRDKIAASKKKGMWMGGLPSLGYDVKDRKLVVNAAEAQTVLHIFQRYVVHRSAHLLKHELDQDGIVSKARRDRNGNPTGTRPIAVGALYHILKNRLYRGEMVHRGTAYPGQHEAIINQGLWDDVPAILAENQIERTTRSKATNPSLLAGLVLILMVSACRPHTPSRTAFDTAITSANR